MEWTPDEIRSLATALEQRRGRGARLTAETLELVVKALRLYAVEGLAERADGFVIEGWDLRRGTVAERIATVSLFAVAEVAFPAACAARPGLRVTMRQGIRQVRVRRPGVDDG